MKFRDFAYLFAAAVLYLVAITPGTALADTLIVQRDGAYPTIQSAIDHVASVRQQNTNPPAFTIQVQDGSYTGNFNLRTANNIAVSNVDIIGASTSGTVLQGVANLNGVQSVKIRNFTFKGGSAGITVSGSSDIHITNNVFNQCVTAISVDSGSSVSVINNTFASNGTAINAKGSVTLVNDIFYRNTTAISPGGTVTLSYGYFFGNGTDGVSALGFGSLPAIGTAPSDPLFVSANDFHLQPGSPAAGVGDPAQINSFNSKSDMGAYGGPNSDILLSPITNLKSTLSGTPPDTMNLTWDATSVATVTNYRVYANTTPNVTATNLFSQPSTVPIGTVTANLTNLPNPASAPDPPQLAAPAPANQALQLSWTKSPTATSYVIYYSTATFDTNTLPASPSPITVNVSQLSDPNNPSYKLTNLTNGQTYYVAVKAVAQTTVYAGVTAVIDTTKPAAPGTANESALSNITSQDIGGPQDSGISGPLTGVPEPAVAYPNVKGEGCFIATAAFGFYSAPQVQALRDFRDRYLLTNAPGRSFVAWYYHYGPIGAHFINQHPWLKPPVRLALLPLVAGALFLLHAPPAAKVTVLILMVVAGCWLVKIRLEKKVRRMMMLRVGGVQ